MKQIKARGIILREQQTGESDKRITIFCKERGRLMVYARGAKKATSKFMAATQMFTYGDFLLTQGSNFYALAQAEIIENFYPLREDYNRLMCAHLIAQACDQTLWDNIESDTLLRLALKSLSLLAKGQLPEFQVTATFLHRFFDVYGTRPQLQACVVCGETSPVKPVLTQEGLVCTSHKPLVYRPITPLAVTAMGHILESSLAQAFMFTAPVDTVEEIYQAARFLWRSHFEWELLQV